MPPRPEQPGAAGVRSLLAEIAGVVEKTLEDHLPAASPHAGQLAPALQHTLQKGKRVRPFVVWQAAETFGLAGEKVLPTACAFELLHTATLIHDDLPCIDDAELRRGLPARWLWVSGVHRELQKVVPQLDQRRFRRPISDRRVFAGGMLRGRHAGEDVDWG